MDAAWSIARWRDATFQRPADGDARPQLPEAP